MSVLYNLIGPLLRRIDPETAHGLAISALKRGLVARPAPVDDARLKQTLWGLDFTNPIGLAAGFDKDAEVTDAMAGQGFGFVEVGSVTPRPQPGNPRPRLFRLPADGAVINRLGFNSAGHAQALENLLKAGPCNVPVGVNLGKNKDTSAEDAAGDYVDGVRAFQSVADYLVLNVSSPNTPGLRALQGREALRELLLAVQGVLEGPSRPALLLKVAPDLTGKDKEDIAAVALEIGIDGLIISNTTIARPEVLKSPHRKETGGLSGRPLFEPSTRVLEDFYRLTEGGLPLIGVGGVSSGAEAYVKIRTGASLVQLYTAMIYRGPGIAAKINRDLSALLQRDGFANVADAVGVDVR
ncbi:MAG: quinone-dependent dihydroorotate dehydrogenase [Proteobacteria bacterium]|nr:quinone-dependent dihydroorotate dehydrogenase [Pseudomonadota bacterium]